MSLLDLHKRATRAKPVLKSNQSGKQNTAVSADDFINEAINYAQGLDNVVPLHQGSHRHNDHQPAANVPLKLISSESSHLASEKVPFRRATFTLSESCIEALAELSHQSDCAKSQLIRMLIRQFDQLTPKQQQAILAEQKSRDR